MATPIVSLFTRESAAPKIRGAEKWARELEYRLIKELWAFGDNRIAVRYCYESQGTDHNKYRSHGNENCSSTKSD